MNGRANLRQIIRCMECFGLRTNIMTKARLSTTKDESPECRNFESDRSKAVIIKMRNNEPT